MNPGEQAGPDEFLALLRSLPGEWNRAKAEAFERLRDTFPDPAGPPEWGLRQILRGQFDRRLTAAWRPAFVEVYHQWLGYRAESEAAADDRPGSKQWWTRALVPALRPRGRGGLLVSPLALLCLLVLAVDAGFVRAAARRTWALQEAKRAEAAVEEARGQHLLPAELAIATLLQDGSTESLIEVLARSAEARRAHELVASRFDLHAGTQSVTEAAAATRWLPPWEPVIPR